MIARMFWVLSWAFFALSTGVVWDFLVTGSLHADSVPARAVLVFLALGLSMFIFFLVDLLGGDAQRAWDRQPWDRARKIIVRISVVFLATAIPYVWFMVWLLKLAWPHILPWFEDIRWAQTGDSAGSSVT